MVTKTPHAIILAAGAGRRLLPLTADRPKVLVEVDGEPLLLRALRQLSTLGVDHATIIIGDRASQVRAVVERAKLPVAFEWVVNHEYATTNNAWSLALAGDALRAGGLLIEGDVVADDSVMAALIGAPLATCWLVRPFRPGMDGAFLQPDSVGQLQRLMIVPKGSSPDSEGFKSMGLLKLSPSYGARLAEWLEREVSTGRRDRYFDVVVADHCSEYAPTLFTVSDGFWTEVDTPEDLAVATAALGHIA